LGNPRVGRTDNSEQFDQTHAHSFAVVPGQPLDQVDEPSERVLDVTAADIQIRDQELRLDVVGMFGSRRTGGGKVRVSGASHQLDAGEAFCDLGIARALGMEPFVLSHGGVEISRAQRLVGNGEAWVGRIRVGARCGDA
jgi:hypothetical protein